MVADPSSVNQNAVKKQIRIPFRLAMIILKQYDFSQTDSYVTLSVPLPLNDNGVPCTHSKPQPYLNECYVKFSAAPYFFELDLLHPVQTRDSKCVVEQGRVTWTLAKQSHGLIWDSVCDNTLISHAQRLDRRDQGHKALMSMEEKEREEFLKHKGSFKREIVSDQMKLETKERELQDLQKKLIKSSLTTSAPQEDALIIDENDDVNQIESIETVPNDVNPIPRETVAPVALSDEFVWDVVEEIDADDDDNSVQVATAPVPPIKSVKSVSSVPGIRGAKRLSVDLKNTNENGKLSHVARTRISSLEDEKANSLESNDAKEESSAEEESNPRIAKEESKESESSTINDSTDVPSGANDENLDPKSAKTESNAGSKVPPVSALKTKPIAIKNSHESVWDKANDLIRMSNFLAAQHLLDKLIGDLSKEMISSRSEIPPLLLIKALVNKITISLVLNNCDLVPALTDCQVSIELLSRRKVGLYGDGSLEHPFQTRPDAGDGCGSDGELVILDQLKEKVYGKWGAILIRMKRTEEAIGVWKKGAKELDSSALLKNIEALNK